MKNFFYRGVVILSLTLLVACGRSGGLYLPKTPVATQASTVSSE